MKTIPVRLKKNSYPIAIGENVIPKLPSLLADLRLGRDAVIISHPIIQRLHGVKVSAALKKAGYTFKVLNVPEGEKSKSAACALSLLNQISAYDVDKKIFIVALGGGVIGDLAGFVAAVYKRGVPYIQIPTTLLAQIDSSIGGKTAIDLPAGKNLVGAFYQPRLVLAETAVLKTLKERQIRNGLAEAVKYGVIADSKLFAYIEANAAKLLKSDSRALSFIVERCAAIKADIVSADEKETKSLRTILNFGHTAGHAIEAGGGYDRYHHGEAVGLGMRVAARISAAMKFLKPADELRINQLITAVGLPGQIKGVGLNKILAVMRHDKKFVAGHNRFVLAHRVGLVKVHQDIPSRLIHQAIQVYLA